MAGSVLVNGPVTAALVTSKILLLGENTGLGGHSVFLGQVRADSNGRSRVKAIEYSAYEEMAGKESDLIRQTILSEFSDVQSVEIIHSVGIVVAGEISLLVIVSGSHRHQAIAACTKTVELIKERLPVWKKEIYEDNSHEWKQNNLA